MRGKSKTELDSLAEGLGNAEDPYFIKPLEEKTLPELVDLVRGEIRYTALSMVRAGRYFMAIKKKVGHGQFEELFLKCHWSPSYVRLSMKLVEVVARFPQALYLPGGLATKNLLRLPMPKIEAVLNELPPEAVKKFTPWDLEKIHRDKTTEEKNSQPRKKSLPPEEAARIMDDFKRRQADKAWFEVDNLWSKAVGALNQLNTAAQKIEMEEKHYDDVFNRDMLRALMAPLEELIRKWHPIEEVEKRAEVMKRPSFAQH